MLARQGKTTGSIESSANSAADTSALFNEFMLKPIIAKRDEAVTENVES
jgi:hypothetical protein